MALNAILEALKVARVVWVDDVFGDPDEDLALVARGHPELIETFPELADAFRLEGYGDVDAALGRAIHDMKEERLAELRVRLLQADAENSPAHELRRGTIESACGHLGVRHEDRWTFEDADKKLAGELGDDTNVAYIIDLKEAGGKDQRGLDIVLLLKARASKGVAFILTHEAAAVGEVQLESDLTEEVAAAPGLAPPLTVISKGRLTEEGADVEAALAIALKRAGLRRALYQVLAAASGRAAEAYSTTARILLQIDPERLEQYVYERGRKEGVSELSVVERALGAGASKAIRTFFGTDAVVLGAIQSLRALQSVPLDKKPLDAGPVLSELRNAEVWDEGDLINTALTPLANGDVFRFDTAEPDGPRSEGLFVLLGQPCDVALRADGKRQSDFAMLVPIKELQEDGSPVPDPNDPDEEEKAKIKEPAFPFRMRGKRFRLDLRNLAYVRMAILDLACFRSDGCVRVEAGHGPNETLPPGARLTYPERTRAADDALAIPAPAPPAPGTRSPMDDRLMLTMSAGKPWDRMRMGMRIAAFAPAPGGHHLGPLPDRVTWFLRREGRIRAPYSSFLLERALRTLSRRAFDSDFTD